MNLIQTNTSLASGYNSSEFNYQRSIESKNKLSADNKILENYINTDTTSSGLRDLAISNHNTNSAIGLVQSIDAAATIIESKLGDIKTLAMQNKGSTFRAIKKIQESIKDIANNFSWNGTNFMVGDGENNQKTTLRNFIVNTGADAKSDLQMNFKSFNPMSAVSTGESLELTMPNLPDLNKLPVTDTHAYGNAALYSKLRKDSYLHTHTKAMRDQAVIQISRAIDGVKRERDRLESYLTRLNNIAETNQSEQLNKSNYMGQRIDLERAYQIAISLKNEIQINPSRKSTVQENINVSRLHGLLN
jgi:hypothetical protein